MMEGAMFKMPLYLPAQGATEVEATIIEWHVAEGDRFRKGQALVQVDSAKSVFDFEAPCDGLLLRRLHLEGETLPLTDPIMEIETSDPAMRDWIPPAATGEFPAPRAEASRAAPSGPNLQPTVLLGFGGYLPTRVVDNAELVAGFPEITAEYVYQVTGIRHRHWADDDEKPSDMAYQAALEAIRDSGIAAKEIDAVIVATTTPDVAMPSTAAILQDRLNLPNIPAFDLNAACSGWLYAVAAAQGMILSGVAHNVLTVGVDMQSRLLDTSDRSAYFL
ncbi:MAG: biotin/lipoyl-containing protein, partial [Thermoguttaceae bacterium]